MIDRDALLRHFPVHVRLDERLVVLQLGHTLQRLGGQTARTFDEQFTIERPTLKQCRFEELASLGPTVVVMRFRPNGLELRGEFIESHGGLTFIGHPAVNRLDDFGPLGLTLNDFAAHDPTADLLTVLVTHRNTLEDLRQVTSRLAKQRRDLQDANVRLREATEEATRASEVKTRFLSHMSHELRTPLHAITGLTNLLLGEFTGNPQERSYLESIQSSSDMLVSIIGQVLDVAKIEAGRMEINPTAFQLASTFEQLMAPLASRADIKGLRFEWSLTAPEGAWVLTDRLRLQQIVLNLVSNAIKFTQQGAISIHVTWANERLRVEVDDTGPGVSEAEALQLFTPFVQGRAHSATQGTGLGLSLSRALATLLSGTLTFEQRPVGSRFVLEVSAPAAAAVVEPSPSPLGSSTVSLKLLLVDDNATNRLLGQRLLERDGHSVTTADDGYEALKLLSERLFDAVLLDVQMPGISGLEVAQEVRRRGNSAVELIAITANALHGDRELCLGAGMNAYLSKPIDVAELRAVLSAVAAKARQSDALS